MTFAATSPESLSASALTGPLAKLIIQEVLEAETRRARALCERDLAALGDLLHPALRYIHATGLMHDRTAYLTYAASGPEFSQVAVHPSQVHAWPGGVVLVLGQLHLRFRHNVTGHPGPWQESCSRVSQLWCPADSPAGVRVGREAGWQLLSFQSTREPEAA